ncbi:MAG: glycosyltransferase [Ignavibacteriaceae bacterium]
MKNSINILHVISDFRRGGKERQLAVLVKYSDSKINHKIATLNDSQISYIEEYQLEQPLRIIKGKFNRFFNLIKIAKKNKFDLIHVWGNSEAVYSIPASIVFGIPLLNGSIRHGIRGDNFNHRFRSIVLQNSKYVLGNSKAGFYANKIMFDDKRHFVLYNGIEEKFFSVFDAKKRENFLDKKKISGNDLLFVTVANFVPYKDYFTILKVLAKLKKDGVKFHYIVIGKGKLENQIRDKINKLDLEKEVSIYNDNPNIPELLSISDIMIHSSLGEGCSNAILEAKAAGLRVVASNTGGTPEIVSEEDYLFEYKNLDDLELKLKEAIKSLKNNLLSRKEIQNKTQERFSVQKMQINYSNIIKAILND